MELYAALAAVLAALGAFLYGKGRSDAKDKRSRQDAKDYEQTIQRGLNNADTSDGDAIDDAEWLRSRGKR